MTRTSNFRISTVRPGTFVVLAAGFLMSACTALPEWTDPGSWFEEETPPPSRISSAQNLDEAKAGDFPNLASVPDKPRAATPSARREAIAAGLAADRSNAQYSGQRLTAKGAEADGAPAIPTVARDLSPPVTKAAAVQPTAQETRGTEIVPAPALSPAPARQTGQSAATPSLAQSAAQADVEVPASAPVLSQSAPAQPWRSELAGIIYFAHGSDALNAEDHIILRDIVAISRENGARIRVIGHASARTSTVDPVEHRIANLEMSQRRADSVAKALLGLGATRDRVQVEAHADMQPVYHEFMPTGEAGNRRTEIFLEY